MLRTLEGIRIKSRGIKPKATAHIALIFISIIFYPCQRLWGQYYYVNTYENPHGPSPEQLAADIFVKSIDLTSNTVTDSVQLSARGEILFKKPAEAFLNNHRYLVTVNVPGLFGKKVFYTILRAMDGSLAVVRDDSIENATVEFFRQYAGEEGFRFGLTTYRERNVIFPTGLYGLDQRHNFRRLRDFNAADPPGTIQGVAPYEYLIKVPFDTVYSLYYTIHDSQWWLVKVNANLTEAIDSLSLLRVSGNNAVFAYHPNRDKLYCLHVNYELHYNEDGDTPWKSREDYYVNPDVWIINPVTLDIEQQLPIPDYPEGNYPGEDRGLADVVGDYLVYYFFKGTGRFRFDPAMLLIFDTRTNEATWLRVGWR